MILVLALLLCGIAATDYALHAKVPVFMNNVSPYYNPAETYKFYSLPYCKPTGVEHPGDENIGAVLAGDRRQASLYDVRFKVATEWQAICDRQLSVGQVEAFRTAILEQYIFELFLDGLAVKGFIGEIHRETLHVDGHLHNITNLYLYTHLDFSVAYNGANIIAVNLTTNPNQRVELVKGQEAHVEFSFSTRWVATEVPFAKRAQLHHTSAIDDQPLEIHWLSIFNSFVLVILLTAFLAVVLLRVLKRDFARYVEIDESDFGEDEEDGGWKLVHGDVFRAPANIMVFSAFLGAGAQLLALVVCLLLLSLAGTFDPGNRGTIYIAGGCLYGLSSYLAGYVATSIYTTLGGKKWALNACLTASTFAGPLFLIFAFNNSVAIAYGSSAAMPFGTIFVLVVFYALVMFPLTVAGSVKGKRAAPFTAPCKVKTAPRQVPRCPWYRGLIVQLLVTGFLPFSAIYVELHYIYAAMWGHRAYTLFGVLALTFVMLYIVTGFISIAMTYFQLVAEDYHWWWRSLLGGFSVGVFTYLYAIFFFVYRSEMSGVLQGSYFFGYMLAVSWGFSLMLGAVSFFCARVFVWHIYKTIHAD